MINLNIEDTTMNFTEIAEARQSCRSYDPNRAVEQEKLERILASAVIYADKIPISIER